MSDKNHNKDPVEQFFQKHVQDYHIQYREEDWLQLEPRLDMFAAHRTYRRRLIWVAAASILIISMLAWATIENRARINELRIQMAESQQQAPLTETELLPLPYVPPDQDQTDQDRSAQDFHVHDAPTDAPATVIDPAVDPSGAPFEGPAVLPRSASALDVILAGLPEPDASAAPGVAYAARATVSTKEITDQPGYNIFNALALGQRSMRPVHRAVGYTPVDAPLQQLASHDTGLFRGDPPGADMSPSRLAVGVRLSPVYSTAGSPVNAYESGYGVGFSLEYRLTPRLTVSTGAGYSVVRYSAAGSDYALSATSFPGQQISDMSGECRILDIPVTLQWRLFEFDRSRIYGTAGLLTYVMLDEAYTFKTSNYYQNNDYDVRWQERTGTWHWFSNAGFSVGYERDLSRTLSLRAEPYVRVPVREVGWASVRLYTIGTMFSIQYRL
jgi:hypothetical protein